MRLVRNGHGRGAVCSVLADSTAHSEPHSESDSIAHTGANAESDTEPDGCTHAFADSTTDTFTHARHAHVDADLAARLQQ